MTRLLCDKCGVELERNSCDRYGTKLTMYGYTDFYLCDKCVNNFHEWLTEERKQHYWACRIGLLTCSCSDKKGDE